MNAHSTRPDRAADDKLHPVVYRTMIGLTIWLVLSVWLLFSRGSDVTLNLIVITFFFLVVVGTPLLISFAWQHNVAPEESHPPTPRFRDWIACEFATWTGGLSGREAAMQILLPIAAVAIGMTIFGLVFVLDVPHLG